MRLESFANNVLIQIIAFRFVTDKIVNLPNFAPFLGYFRGLQAQNCHLRELDLCAATLLVFTNNPDGE